MSCTALGFDENNLLNDIHENYDTYTTTYVFLSREFSYV